jgi:hypothetical protein
VCVYNLRFRRAMCRPNIVICGLFRSIIFFHINGTIFEYIYIYIYIEYIYIEYIYILNIKCVFWFSVQFLSEIFLILRRTERDIFKNINWSSCKSNGCSCKIINNFEYSRRIFEKYSNINFIKLGPGEAELFHADRRTDRHDEGKNRFSQFCEQV